MDKDYFKMLIQHVLSVASNNGEIKRNGFVVNATRHITTTHQESGLPQHYLPKGELILNPVAGTIVWHNTVTAPVPEKSIEDARYPIENVIGVNLKDESPFASSPNKLTLVFHISSIKGDIITETFYLSKK